MVVAAIFVILSAVVLSNNSRFGNLIVLENLAHDIAFSVRQAQVYGIAVQRYGADQFDVAYGIHFAPESGYELFADVDWNGVFDISETVRTTSIAGGYRITNLCVRLSGQVTDTCGIQNLHIVFKRPEPSACIGSGAVTLNYERECTSSFSRARIQVESNRGDQANVIVESSGQISVQ